MTDKKKMAERIREHLERRLCATVGCAPEDLRCFKTGTIAHLLILMIGDAESMPGFSTSLRGLIDLIGQELLWEKPDDVEEQPQTELTKAVVN